MADRTYPHTLAGLRTKQDRFIAERGIGIGGGTLGSTTVFPVKFTDETFGIVSVEHDTNVHPLEIREWNFTTVPDAIEAVRSAQEMPQIFALGDCTVILGTDRNGQNFVVRIYYSEGAEMHKDSYTTDPKEHQDLLDVMLERLKRR